MIRASSHFVLLNDAVRIFDSQAKEDALYYMLYDYSPPLPLTFTKCSKKEFQAKD
jgi:hypothetical protein